MSAEDVDNLILKILARQPTHGYDIFKQLQDMHVTDSRSFLYKKLKALAKRDIIHDVKGDSGRGFPKSIWHLTRKGQELHYDNVMASLKLSEIVVAERLAAEMRAFTFDAVDRLGIAPRGKRLLLDVFVPVDATMLAILKRFFSGVTSDNEVCLRHPVVPPGDLAPLRPCIPKDDRAFDYLACVSSGLASEVDPWITSAKASLVAGGNLVVVVYSEKHRPHLGPYEQVAQTFEGEFRARFETEVGLCDARPVLSNEAIRAALTGAGCVDVDLHAIPFLDLFTARAP